MSKKKRSAAARVVSPRKVALAAADAALSKQALQVTILDVRGKVDYADFLVLASGTSDRHVQAIATAVEEQMRRLDVRKLGVEGLGHAQWVLMDFGAIIAHVFHRPVRPIYDLEGLWMDAKRIPLPVEGGREAS